MYERFSDRARRVFQLANQEALRFNHEFIGTEHILLGIVKEGSGVAANVLRNLMVDLRKIRLEVEKLVLQCDAIPAASKLPQSPKAKQVVQYAMEESVKLKDGHVGTEHILIALTRVPDSVARQVLFNLGVTMEHILAEMERIRTMVHPSAVTVGDVIRLPVGDNKFRVWKIVSVNLGGVGQEDVIGLEAVDRMAPTTGSVMQIPADVLVQGKFERV